jgi:hypothetical protein
MRRIALSDRLLLPILVSMQVPMTDNVVKQYVLQDNCIVILTLPMMDNVVKQYVSQDNCIVLLTLPMTDDATNLSTARIICGIDGSRLQAVYLWSGGGTGNELSPQEIISQNMNWQSCING